MIFFIHIIKNIKIITVLKWGLYAIDDFPFALLASTSFEKSLNSTITSFFLRLFVKSFIFDCSLGICASKMSFGVSSVVGILG